MKRFFAGLSNSHFKKMKKVGIEPSTASKQSFFQHCRPQQRALFSFSIIAMSKQGRILVLTDCCSDIFLVFLLFGPQQTGSYLHAFLNTYFYLFRWGIYLHSWGSYRLRLVSNRSTNSNNVLRELYGCPGWCLDLGQWRRKQPRPLLSKDLHLYPWQWLLDWRYNIKLVF